MVKGFIENGFIIDLSNTKDTSEIISELSNILEIPEAKGKKVCLKLRDIDLTQSQLLSIKSLIETSSQLEFVDTNSEITKASANILGIEISELSNEIEIVEEKAEVQNDDNEDEQEQEEEQQEQVAQIESPQETLPEKPETEDAQNYEVSDDNSNDGTYKIIKQVVIDTDNEEVFESEKLSTLYLRKALRSGQTMSYDGNIVLIGDAKAGSEIIAKGDITVWGVLSGIAHAGSRGNDNARIRALKLNAIQLRISGYYARRPDTVNIPYIQRSNEFTPEEAKVEDGVVQILKMNEI